MRAGRGHQDRGRGARQRRVAQQEPQGQGEGGRCSALGSQDGHTSDLMGKTLELWN